VSDIEQALAEALHECKAVGGPWTPCDDRGECDCWSMSKHVLATEPMQAIARRAALADQLAKALRECICTCIDTDGECISDAALAAYEEARK